MTEKLLADIDRLNKLLREYRKLVKAKDKLLVAYRLGRQAGVGAAIDKSHAAEAKIAELEKEPGT